MEKINCQLQANFNTIEKYTVDWNMKINLNKCETILFRPPVNKCNSNVRKNWKNFRVKSCLSDTYIANKDVVKYLGIYLDKFLYFNKHINETLKKAQKAFFAHRGLFYSRHINNKVKILMYQALADP